MSVDKLFETDKWDRDDYFNEKSNDWTRDDLLTILYVFELCFKKIRMQKDLLDFSPEFFKVEHLDPKMGR